MSVPTLTKRLEKGAPLTPGEMDANFNSLESFGNTLETRVNVSLNEDGSIKDGAVTGDSIPDGGVAAEKLSDEAVVKEKLATSAIGDGLTKPAKADLLSVKADGVTLDFVPLEEGEEEGTPKKLRIKPNSITTEQLADSIRVDTGYAILVHEEAPNTAGGSVTASTWQVRPINNIKLNTGGIVTSLSANRIKFALGTYRFSIQSQFYGTEATRTRFRNLSTSTTIAVGTSIKVNSSTGESTVVGKFTVTDANHEFAVEVNASGNQASNGFGYPANLGENEVYAIAQFTKET